VYNLNDIDLLDTGCHGEMGNLPYFQIDEMVKSGDYDSLTFNSNTGSMEMVSGNSWTSYDSEETLNIKYRYAYDQCLRGIMW
jgi:chitinase